MVEEHRQLQNDILAPDDVVVLLDGAINTAIQSIRSSEPLHVLNYRLLSLRPADLNDPLRIRAKVTAAITAVEAGTFDVMLTRAAALQSAAPGNAVAPQMVRDQALYRLQQLLVDDDALATVVRLGKQSVEETRAKGVLPTEDSDLEKAAAYIGASNSPITPAFDHIFAAERIPFVLFDTHSDDLRKVIPNHNGYLLPSDAGHIFLSKDVLTESQRRRDYNALVANLMLFDQLFSRRLGLMMPPELEHLPGVDYAKMKYYLGRKRSEVASYNRTAPREIRMFVDEETVARSRANTDDPYVSQAMSLHDPSGILSQVHHLLTYYTGEGEQAKIRNRFDEGVRFHQSAMAELDRRIEERLQAARLPPPVHVEPLQPEPAGQAPSDSRQPRTPEWVIETADGFARSRLPDHYKLRVLLEPTPQHPITLKLTDDHEHTVTRTIETFQPNLDRAREIKQQVQSHLLRTPGITAYRDPLRTAHYSIADDQFIPRPTLRSYITTKYGEYRLQLQWPRLHEDMQFSLGVPHDESESSRAAAQHRADHVMDMLASLREQHTQGDYLPVTKADVVAELRQWVEERGQAFEELTREPIDRFPVALRLPFSGPNNDQDCWLHVDALKPDGAPNYTWILPVRIAVNGEQLVGSADINLHVRDRRVAESRAIDAVNQFLLEMNQYARPGGGFALKPDDPHELQPLSEPERNASPQLIDAIRLRDMYNRLRSPFRQDLDVRMVAAPEEVNGRTRFTIGIIRGGCDGLEERVREIAENSERPMVTRRFTVPTAQAEQFSRFLQAVQGSFRATVDDAYDPRSPRNYDRAQRQVIQWPRKFHPGYAPKLLDDAIRTHLPEFPDIGAERAPRSARRHDGSQGRA